MKRMTRWIIAIAIVALFAPIAMAKADGETISPDKAEFCQKGGKAFFIPAGKTMDDPKCSGKGTYELHTTGADGQVVKTVIKKWPVVGPATVWWIFGVVGYVPPDQPFTLPKTICNFSPRNAATGMIVIPAGYPLPEVDPNKNVVYVVQNSADPLNKLEQSWTDARAKIGGLTATVYCARKKGGKVSTSAPSSRGTCATTPLGLYSPIKRAQVRSKANYNGAVVALLTAKDTVEATSCVDMPTGPWLIVKHSGKDAFVAAWVMVKK